MTAAQFDSIRSRQLPDADKRARADFVIETTDMDSTRAAVQDLVQHLTGKNDA
jgi:dephospho-CoA kinase